jgi:uncharacterized OB-fold protein
MEVIKLSRRGKIYSATDVFIGQPTMREYMPMAMAYVDLPEGVRVFAQLEGEIGSFQCGASPLTPKDPFVLIWNDPWDAQLLSWQI